MNKAVAAGVMEQHRSGRSYQDGQDSGFETE